MVGIGKVKIMFVEGETEMSFFQKLKRDKRIAIKSIVKKNLWQDNIKNYAITIPKNSELYIVFDSDEVGQAKRFIDNVNFLRRRGHSIFLLQQKNNFEEELAWCCGKTLPKFITAFCVKKTSGVSDFKRDFIACGNPLSKLLDLGLQETILFSRELHEALRPLIKMKSKFSNHFSCL